MKEFIYCVNFLLSVATVRKEVPGQRSLCVLSTDGSQALEKVPDT